MIKVPRLSSLRKISPACRVVVLGQFAASVGAGMYITGAAVYFVRNVGLSASQVGAGLSAAALAGLSACVIAGRLADRLGARTVAVAAGLCAVPPLLVMTQVRSFWAFVLAAATLGVAVYSLDVARGALIAAVAGTGQEARLASYDRSAFNTGFSVGLLFAGVAITVGSRTSFVVLFIGDAAALATAALITLRLPRAAGRREAQAKAKVAYRDLPYLLVGQISSMTRLGDVILTVGLPLWLILRTHAPRGLAAWLLAVNTVLVVTLQARATRRAGTINGAAQLQRRAFVVLAAACVIIIPTHYLSAWAAAIVLGAVTVLLTAGELWGEGAWFTLRYALAAPDAQGEYGGVFALGQAVPGVAGPVLVTTLAVTIGIPGWLILAGVFVIFAVICRGPLERARQGSHRAGMMAAPSADETAIS